MAWTKTTKGKYTLLEESITIADSGGANATYGRSTAIPAELFDWENKKVTVTFNVTEASAGNGGADAYIQTSVNGTTTNDVDTPGSGANPDWVNASANINASLDTTSTDSHESHLVDLTDVYAPYMRVYIYTDGTDILDACTIKVSLAILPVNGGMQSGDFGGIGADPS